MLNRSQSPLFRYLVDRVNSTLLFHDVVYAETLAVPLVSIFFWLIVPTPRCFSTMLLLKETLFANETTLFGALDHGQQHG
jgi:hypothetical protein